MLTFCFSRKSSAHTGIHRTARRAEHGAAVDVDMVHQLAGELDGFMPVGGVQSRVAVPDAQDVLDAVAMMEFQEHRPEHVVQAGTQPTTGGDGGARTLRVEEDVAARDRHARSRCPVRIVPAPAGGSAAAPRASGERRHCRGQGTSPRVETAQQDSCFLLNSMLRAETPRHFPVRSGTVEGPIGNADVSKNFCRFRSPALTH